MWVLKQAGGEGSEGPEAAVSSDAGHEQQQQQPQGPVSIANGQLRLRGKLAEALVGGVALALDAPIAWLHANLAHPDHFLYVVVVARE